MKTIKRHTRTAAIALVVGAALATNASARSNMRSAPSHHDAIQAFMRCMSAHGVNLQSSYGINPHGRSFKLAREACDRVLPGYAKTKAELLKVSRCMRQHGISRFPNPADSVPFNPARAIALHGLILAIPPSINVRSSAFKDAAAMCNFPPNGSYPLRAGGLGSGSGYSW